MKKSWLLIALLGFYTTTSQQVKAKKVIKKDSVYINYINTLRIPIEINSEALDSTKSYIKVKDYAFLNYQDTIKNALVIPLNRIQDTASIHISSYISFKGSIGDPSKIADDSLYSLPFPKGKKYKIMQSFGGSFSHNLESSYYAIDFEIPIGDTITAARGGKVFFVKEDSKTHCPTRDCIGEANKVLVLHTDGTYANYVHLNYQGALVKEGDVLQTGDIIGISGMTGFTTKSHLHFVVHKASGISIPIYFNGLKKKKLKQGKFYKRRK